MSIARTRMQELKQSQQLQQQSSSQRVGALSLIPSCLGISGHPSGSRQGHPRYTGARSAGRPWVARTHFSTAVQCRNTPNIAFLYFSFCHFFILFIFSLFHFFHLVIFFIFSFFFYFLFFQFFSFLLFFHFSCFFIFFFFQSSERKIVGKFLC